MAGDEALLTAAQLLAALGHPTRLAVFLYLRGAGPAGANVGAIQARVGVPGSTLSHHLERLRHSGALLAQRQERFVYYRVNPTVEDALGEGLASLATDGTCG